MHFLKFKHTKNFLYFNIKLVFKKLLLQHENFNKSSNYNNFELISFEYYKNMSDNYFELFKVLFLPYQTLTTY